MAFPSLVRGLEERDYQLRLAAGAEKRNTLICLPTGLGKTNIAILVAARRLKQFPESRVLVLAPTKPLVSQHYQSFTKFLAVGKEELQISTGTVPPEKRSRVYGGRIIFATPQTVQKDLEEGRLSLRDFSLLVIDELHHAVGRYSYPFIAQRFLKEAAHPRVLGLTASPGSDKTKIQQICRNTGIDTVEVRTEADHDVRPYVKERNVEWVEVALPDSFQSVRNLLKSAYMRRVSSLRGIRTRRDLLALQRRLQDSIHAGSSSAYGLASLVAQAIKLEHALTLVETQGIGILRAYLRGLRDDESKAALSVLEDRDVARAVSLTEQLFAQGSRHPKMGRLCSLIGAQLRERPDSKMIVFATFRDTVREIAAVLAHVEGVRPLVLSGQRDLSQKEQMEVIRRYEQEANILVTTSIGEEGLSLEAADLAVFYEPVPSEIRHIQRRGRVGRTKSGKILVLVTKGTRDETSRWAAYHKERKMRRTLETMQRETGDNRPASAALE